MGGVGRRAQGRGGGAGGHPSQNGGGWVGLSSLPTLFAEVSALGFLGLSWGLPIPFL